MRVTSERPKAFGVIPDEFKNEKMKPFTSNHSLKNKKKKLKRKAKAKEEEKNKKGGEVESTFKLQADLSDLEEDELDEQCSKKGGSKFEFFKDFTSSVSIGGTNINFAE